SRQVDRGGTGVAELRHGPLEIRRARPVAAGRQGDPVGAGHADGGGTTHRQPLDGIDELLGRGDLEDPLGVGAKGLVDQADGAVGPFDGGNRHLSTRYLSDNDPRVGKSALSAKVTGAGPGPTGSGLR